MNTQQDLEHALKALEAAAKAIQVAAQKIVKVHKELEKPRLKVVDNDK